MRCIWIPLFKTTTGSLSPGLYIVAAVEICATLLIMAFIPRAQKAPVGAAALAH